MLKFATNIEKDATFGSRNVLDLPPGFPTKMFFPPGGKWHSGWGGESEQWTNPGCLGYIADYNKPL